MSPFNIISVSIRKYLHSLRDNVKRQHFSQVIKVRLLLGQMNLLILPDPPTLSKKVLLTKEALMNAFLLCSHSLFFLPLYNAYS